jgi:hypothetical protein
MATYVQGKENDSRIHIGKGRNNITQSGNVTENFYMKQVVIYLLRIWIIEGILQISLSCVRVVYLEVTNIGPNTHCMAQNGSAI